MHKDITIAVCDDEECYRERIKILIEEHLAQREVSVKIDLYKNGRDFCKIETNYQKYDVIFLAINMKGKNGMEVARDIRKRNRFVEIVFITVTGEYVFEGYAVKAFRYIMKSNMEDELQYCLDALIMDMEYKHRQMKFKFTDGMRVINLDELLYIESKSHKLYFELMNECLYLYEKIDVMEKVLSEYAFVRTHQSFLVNIQHIERVSNYRIYLTNGTQVPVTKARYQEVKEKFLK